MSALATTRAENIRHHLRLAEASLRDSFTHYLNAGALLIEQKSNVAHGEWLGWLEENIGIGEREAQRYMQLAEHREQIEAANPSGMSDLSLTAALKQIQKPKAVSAGEMSNLFARTPLTSSTPVAAAPTPVPAREPEPEALLDDLQQRRLDKAIGQLQEALHLASNIGRLSRLGVAGVLGDAARQAQFAAVALDELKSTFER